MNARVKFYVDIEDAARIAYPPGWRLPPVGEIEQQRAAEAREDQRREDDYREGDEE
jgi:hypothetical protein